MTCCCSRSGSGTGFLVSGRRVRAGRRDADLEAAIAQMRTLNRAASEVLVAAGVRGRDRRHRVRAAGARPRDGARLRARGSCSTRRALPALDGALDLARAGVETGGAAHNRRFTAPALTVGDGVAPELVALAHDPQTSRRAAGGDPGRSTSAVEAAAARRPASTSWRVGRVEAGEPGVALR